MQTVSAQELAKKKSSASCCNCGKEAAEAGLETWTIQGGNVQCTRCSRNEELY